MRATAKLTFLVAVMATTASVTAWAQTRDRSVDAGAPAETSATPQLSPVFAVNNNTVGYYHQSWSSADAAELFVFQPF